MVFSRFRKIAVSLLTLGLVIAPAAPALAQSENGSGLSISPTRTELSIKPGEAGTVSITLKNVTKGNVTAKALVNDFEADNDTGEPKLITDDSKQSAATIRNFLLGLDDIPLKPGEQKEIIVPVQIPSDASPGAYYGVIRYQAVPVTEGSQGAGQVALTASVGSLVLIEVPGNITEKIQILSAGALISGKAGSVFTKKPNQVGIKIKNLGNSFAKPFGQVQVQNMSGKNVQTYELNNSTPRGNVLPAAERTFRDELKGVSTPGRYKIVANISYGSGGEVLNYTSTFWYVPVWLLIVLAVLLVVLTGSAFYLFKRYNSRSISRRK